MTNRFRAFRQFERFIFRGVPEHPESIYERETNGNVGDRKTGKDQLSNTSDVEQNGGNKLIAKIYYHFDRSEIEIVREDEKLR